MFPLFMVFTFTFFPLLFSFNDSSNQIVNLTNVNKIDENKLKPINGSRINETILVKKSFWPIFQSTAIEKYEKEPSLVLYDENRVSIFSQAVDSLMNFSYKPYYNQLALPSIKMGEVESSAYSQRKIIPALVNPRPNSGFSSTEAFFFETFDK